MTSWDRLLAECTELEETARKIQNGKSIGLPEAKIRKFVDDYHTWYNRCLQVLPEELKQRFRSFYFGAKRYSIKQFLEEPTKRDPSYDRNYKQFGDAGIALGMMYHYPYENSFHEPLRCQRNILIEAKANQFESNPAIAASEAIANIERISRRFHLVAKPLSQRHSQREPFSISDEYDVQDLFHALLQLYFEDIRPEEWTPSYAGGHSRIDFFIKSEQVMVEIKKTRGGLRGKEISDQLIIDINRYRAHPNCKTLVAFVYDPARLIDNPKGLENDLSQPIDGMRVKVIIAPH